MFKHIVLSCVIAAALAGCSGGGNPTPVTPVTPSPGSGTATPSASPSAVASVTPSATPTVAAPTATPSAGPSATASASAAPTAMPTATASSSAITSSVNPIILTSNVHSSGCTVSAPQFTITESGYTGAFTAVSGNTSLVTVSGGPTTFTATQETAMDVQLGTMTNITVKDANNNQLVIAVYFNGYCLN